jgi:hypothetical protein
MVVMQRPESHNNLTLNLAKKFMRGPSSRLSFGGFDLKRGTQPMMLSASRQTVDPLKDEPLTFLAIAPDKSYS